MEVRQLRHLRGRCIGNLLPAVTDIHAPEAAAGVEELASSLVRDANAGRLLDDDDFVRRLGVWHREAVQDIGAVEGLQVRGDRFGDGLRLHLDNLL